MKIAYQTLFLIKTFIFMTGLPSSIYPLKLDRVILSCDSNPEYIQFWPIVAKVWRERFGIKPTLAFIANPDIPIDEKIGDVIRFKPIEGVSDALYAQLIRLLLPILYKNDISILSDIDMIPISKKFFLESIDNVPDTHFVVYRAKALPQKCKEYPMCYNAAKGSVFSKIFHIENISEIPSLIKYWSSLKLGWSTDQQVLYKYLKAWNEFDTHCTLLGNKDVQRIDRSKKMAYNAEKLRQGDYVDAHCLRPYHKHQRILDELLTEIMDLKD